MAQNAIDREVSLEKAKAAIQEAEGWAQQQDKVLRYLRSDHVGMIRGDGEITRYMQAIQFRIAEHIAIAMKALDDANVEDGLPF